MVPPGRRGDDQMEAPRDWPQAPRPYPTRPYPTRPYPTRPYPTRGERAPSPYPTRGERAPTPYPTRDEGAAMPYPTDEGAAMPYPTRPYPTRAEAGEPGARLDADEWSADVSDLFYARSAVIGLGARVLVGEGRIPVPQVLDPKPEYLTRPAVAINNEAVVPQVSAAAAKAKVGVRALQPRNFELAFNVIVPDGLTRELATHPDSAWAVKEDMARALALRADQAFLEGAGKDDQFFGIGTLLRAAADALKAKAAGELVRLLLARLREVPDVVFACPGWILSPETLNALATAVQGDRTWDSTGVLELDGADGGRLLGYPFITSPAAGKRIYLGADWSEAWIGMERRLVGVDVSREANVQRGETVIRAVSHHDLVIRRPELFVAGIVK